MAPKSPVAPHQFEVFNELVRRGRRAWIREAIAYVVGVLGLLLAVLSFNRPVPVVVRSDSAQDPAQVVIAGDASVREIDAKRFFLKMGGLLHGWSSASVVEDLTGASLLMTTAWRKRFTGEVNAMIDVPKEVSEEGRASQLSAYVAARIRNEFEFDWDTIKCSEVKGTWHCKARAEMKVQPLVGNPVDDPKLTRSLSVKASFVPVRTTLNTIDGLLVDFWDAKERE